MTTTLIERIAKAICAHNTSGFCCNVGGDLGCKVGRGKMPDAGGCKASLSQLRQSREYDMARAALEAMKTPSEVMKESVRKNGGDIAVAWALAAWPDMIEAALNEEQEE